MNTYMKSQERRAVVMTRELGGDPTEELEAFREARRQRHLLSIQVDELFAQRGWK